MELFNINDFMPHGHCYLWKKDILLMNVGSDIIISMCYLAIPMLLLIILKKRKDLPFRGTVTIFAVFIFFCSLTHIMEIINVWYPLYYLTGVVKVATAIVSLGSSYVILKNLNKILSLPTFSQIESKLFDDIHSIMDNLPVGIIFSNTKGQMTYSNNYIHKLFGYNKEELRNADVELLISDSLKESHIEYRNDYFDNPVEKTMGAGRILKGLTKLGGEKFLEIGLQPMEMKVEDDTAAIVAIKDITQDEYNKRSLTQTTELVRIATYGIPSPLSYIDSYGKYQFVNEAYMKRWNVKEADIVGKKYTEHLPEELKDEVSKRIEDALNGKEFNFTIEVNFPLLGKRLMEFYYIPHMKKDSKVVLGVIVLGHDITDMDKIVKELERTNKQLEEYAFLVSHDLRAPVRHIGNFLELLEEELDGRDDNEKIVKYTRIVKENSLKIQKMISGMLKISSIRQIEPVSASVDLRKVLKGLAESHYVDVDIIYKNDAIEFYSDVNVLEHIFSNLFQNSVKFSENTKPKIIVELSSSKKGIVIDYKDDGVGIAEDMSEIIFNPFFKTKESTGLGLGMTIVTRSLEILGGRIKCVPFQEGAHFQIEIPHR